MGIIEKVKKAAEVAGEKGKRVAATTGIVFTMAATGVGCSKTPAPQAATEATTDAAEIAAEAEQAAADATAAEKGEHRQRRCEFHGTLLLQRHAATTAYLGRANSQSLLRP